MCGISVFIVIVLFFGPQLKEVKNTIKEGNIMMAALVEVKNLPQVKPYKCVQTATMHAGKVLKRLKNSYDVGDNSNLL